MNLLAVLLTVTNGNKDSFGVKGAISVSRTTKCSCTEGLFTLDQLQVLAFIAFFPQWFNITAVLKSLRGQKIHIQKI